MAITEYYGERHGTTYLEIYTQPDDGSERIIHRHLRDQDAYDTWHLALYMKEVLSHKRLLAADEITLEQLPRKEKTLLLYLILACRPKFNTILELGSSLFEMIDGLELEEAYLRATRSSVPVIDLKELSYIGVEISELLSLASMVLHTEYSITLYPDVTEVHDHCDVLYNRSVTNYTFESSKGVAEFINLSEVALMNIFFSRGSTFVSSRLGKTLTYFSLEEVVAHLDKPLFHLFGEKAPGPFSGQELSMGKPVVEGFFLYSEPGFAEEFIAMAHRDATIQSYFNQKEIVPKEALTLLED